MIAILLLAALLLPVSTRADVIYQPFDSFYEQNWDECEYVCRSYTANGPNGDVTLYKSPVDDMMVSGSVPNGEAVFVSYTYEDSRGIVWGCCEIWEEDLLGWAPMDYLVLIYDGISFEEEYADRFVAEEGSIGKDYLGQTIYFWQYPGSTAYFDMELQSDPDGYMPEYSTIYLDEAGNKWAKCSYYMGIKGYWINLNDPTANEDIFSPEATEQAEPVPTEVPMEPVEEIVPVGNQSLKVVTIAAVAAVVAVTGLLLIFLKRKK